MSSEDLRFYGRYVLMETKKLLGVRLSGERNHISERILRGMTSGAIHPESALTTSIETDGFGSQALARLSVKAAARHLGRRYVHSPFVSLEHPEIEPRRWVEACEAELDLGRGCMTRANSPYPVIDGADFVAQRQLWDRPHVIALKNAYHYCNRDPDLYRSVTGTPTSRLPTVGPLQVAVHARRGDVSDTVESHRFTSGHAIRRSLQILGHSFDRLGRAYAITVYTSPEAGDLPELSEIPCTIVSEIGALQTFARLREADVLLTAKSSFSYLAALYCRGIVIYDSYKNHPRADWITRDRAGGFSPAEFEERYRRSLKT